MNLVFLGPPGSGKGTQASRLAQRMGMVHLSTGDILRSAVNRKTELGQKAESYMSAGNLVPDDLVVGMIENRIKSGALDSGFILDGFPRTIPQAESFKAMLQENGTTLGKAVHFVVDDSVVVNRISGRRFCPECNASFNVFIESQMPSFQGRCDNEGAKLQQREDDTEEVVRNRLEVYKKQTEPIVDFYRKESLLVDINADDGPDEVMEVLLKIVNG